jgi:hypothetical protein
VHAKHGEVNNGAIELLLTSWRRGWLTAYICVTCGHTELCLDDPQLLGIVAQQWPIVASEV